MRLKGALRAVAADVAPSLHVRKALEPRRYYPENGAHDAQNRPHEAIYLTPVIDRQLWQDFANKDRFAGQESFCLKFRSPTKELWYDMESEAPNVPFEGAEIVPSSAKDVVCRNLTAEGRATLIKAWDGGMPLQNFIDLAAKLGELDEKVKASIFQKLGRAQRLGHMIQCIPCVEAIGADVRPV